MNNFIVEGDFLNTQIVRPFGTGYGFDEVMRMKCQLILLTTVDF